MGLTLRTQKIFFFFFVLGCKDLDLALRIESPTTPTHSSFSIDIMNNEKWERSSCMTLMIIKCGISETFRGVISEEFVKEKNFVSK